MLKQLDPALFNPAHEDTLAYRLHLDRAPAGAGKKVRAGPGKKVKAGPGREALMGLGLRQGLWQSFGPMHGMADRIRDMVQDRHVDLWLSV